MTWREYLPLAEKTLSTQFHCEFKEQLYLHAVMGSLTEIEELLDNYNLKNGELLISVEKQGSVAEESADIFWYLSILFRELNLSLEDNPYKKIDDELNGFEILLRYLQVNLKMLDSLKKKLYYNKNIDVMIFISQTFELYSLLENYCHYYNTDISSILEKNIAKLKSRYGEKFSSERAINRDLEAEKKILENE